MKKLFVLAVMIFTLLINSCTTEVTKEIIVKPENGALLSEVGTQLVKIISDNKSVFFTINVAESILSGSEITEMPTKVDYNEGEKFSSAGLIISEIRVDGSFVYREE